MGPLINIQKSVFLPLLNNHKLYRSKIFAKESESLVRIATIFVWKQYACAASYDNKLKKHNILHLNEAVGILHVLSTIVDLSKINWALTIFPLLKNICHQIFHICIN